LLPNIINDQIPRVSKVVLLSGLLFGIVGLVYSLSCFEVFTPGNSNAYCLFQSLICHLGIVVGPAALFALKMTNYSVYPSIYAPALASRRNLLNLSKIQGWFAKGVVSLPAITAIPIGLIALVLNLSDELNMYYAPPALFWLAFITSAMHYQSRAMLVPLWLSRQFSFSAGFGVFTTVISGYKLVDLRLQSDESRKVLNHIQRDIDSKRTESSSKKVQKMKEHQELMKDLKDPFM
jgi:hypothetical protein